MAYLTEYITGYVDGGSENINNFTARCTHA